MKTFNWLLKEKYKYRLNESDTEKFNRIRFKQLEAEYTTYVNRFPSYIKSDQNLGKFKDNYLIYIISGKNYTSNSKCILEKFINEESYDQLYYDSINRKWLTVTTGKDSSICWYSFRTNPTGKGLDELLLPFVNVLRFNSEPALKLNLYSTLIIDTIEDYEMFLLHVPEIKSTLRFRFIHL